MKWPSDQTAIMQTAFAQFLRNCSVSLDDIKADYPDPVNRLYTVERLVTYDIQYSDSHPAYSPGEWDDGTIRPARKRLAEYSPEFVLYPDGCNDDHRLSMLKHVAKFVGLI